MIDREIRCASAVLVLILGSVSPGQLANQYNPKAHPLPTLRRGTKNLMLDRMLNPPRAGRCRHPTS